MHYFRTLKFPASQFSGFMHLSTKLSLLILHSDDFAFSHHDEFTRGQRVSELNRTIKPNSIWWDFILGNCLMG